jgi:hypothetical protein
MAAVPFECRCTPLANTERAGAAARSLAWVLRVADGEW